MNADRRHPREQIVATMRRIYRCQMTTSSGGNLSIREPDGGIWITPARVDKGELQPADMVYVRPDGTKDGRHAPSSELPFHREVYRRRPDLHAIVHAHPGGLVAFSICRLLPEIRVQLLPYTVCGRVAYAAYARTGSEQLGRNIAEAFATGADCVMLENHGVVVGGRDLLDAFQRFETLESVAQTLVRAATIGDLRVLPADRLVERLPPEPGELAPSEPTDREKELRAQICRFVHRACHRRLFTTNAGSFSARLGAEQFLITPRRQDRLELEPADLVRATAEACEPGKHPSRTARLHAAIYRRNPDVGAIINAQPANTGAFCVTDAVFSTYTIPESYLVLNQVVKLPHACLVADADRIAGAISLAGRPAVLIENEGALVVGKSVPDAFDRLEVLEATAEALVLSRPLGPLVPMPASAIEEMRRVFG
jgi:L-fuculose-phosphate aldolase